MILVEEMDRTLKAWVQGYGDVNPEGLSVLKILGKLDIMFCTREPNPPDIRAALDLVSRTVRMQAPDPRPQIRDRVWRISTDSPRWDCGHQLCQGSTPKS